MPNRNIAIIGGGLAGACLAKLFHEKDVRFHWYSDEISSASHISSGILNPVTGRRYALAWNYQDLINIAKEYYGDFLVPIRLEKHFKPFKDEATIDKVILGKEKYLSKINEEWIEVMESYQLRTNDFINFIIKSLNKNNQVINKEFNYTLLHNTENQWHYLGHVYDNIIFAEGIFIKNNPFFNYLPFQPNRGEALIIDIQENKPSSVKKHGKFICPFGEKFWVGSSFDKVEFEAPLLTDKAKQDMMDAIPKLIGDSSYHITSHFGALRSTTPDRRPIIGEHPLHKGLYLFNGFGTKGASLIPWCAIQLINSILKDTDVPFEVSITRI
jgi:glycine oxidase